MANEFETLFFTNSGEDVTGKVELISGNSSGYIDGQNIPCDTPLPLPQPRKSNVKTQVQSSKTALKGNPKTPKQTLPLPQPRKPNAYNYGWDTNRTDKRVSLNCAPLTNNTSTIEYIDRLKYVLGSAKTTVSKGQTLYGFLSSMLYGSCGLIFPYTPNVSIQHTVNYERTDITHSNLAISHYKNTPPPTISIDATFTADTRENALHMLSAIWFLRACTKCDFGEMANGAENTYAGMPPSILYLNGYNQIMDNIPVVITGFSYTLPQDRDYVALGVNLDSDNQAFNDWKVGTYQTKSGNVFNSLSNFDGNAVGDVAMKYVNGIRYSIEQIQQEQTIIEANRYNNYYFNNWLPTEMKFGITLQIQPNLMKYKKLYNSNYYKMGLYNLPQYKTDSRVFLPNEGGGTEVTNTTQELCQVEFINQITVEAIGQTNNSNNQTSIPNDNKWKQYLAGLPIGKTIAEKDGTVYEFTKQQVATKKSQIDTKTSGDTINTSTGSWKTKSFSYTFDRSGWTW